MAVNFNDKAVAQRIRAATARGLFKAAELVRTEAISLVLNTPKTGRVYQRRGVQHQASAPGEPFASDTGATVNSIQAIVDEQKLEAYIATNENGRRLELGTQKMEPRPFLRPALANKRAEAEQTIRDEVAAELRK